MDTWRLGALLFEHDRRDVSQRRVEPLVIVEMDVAADRLSKRVVGVEGSVVVHVGFHRLVPGLHVRVVVHPARTIG